MEKMNNVGIFNKTKLYLFANCGGITHSREFWCKKMIKKG